MSVRLVSSARNLREQFKSSNNQSNPNLLPSNSSVYTTNTSHSAGPQSISGSSSLSRQGSLLKSPGQGGSLRRSKSMQKKTLIAKVFNDNGSDNPANDSLPDLSMEMTLLIVRRCVKEIRERGLTTKGILRQHRMVESTRVIVHTIRMILDDDANTELSSLRQVDIHLVVHAMKWAMRYSEGTLVTYSDYEALYLDQGRSFSTFIRHLPPLNRYILLDLFSLCADVIALSHLNEMTLVIVAKSISLSIMAEEEGTFTTFDASLQARNLCAAACEDLLRTYLRIKTTHDLAKIEQEDELDENRFVDNLTRVVTTAKQHQQRGPESAGPNGPPLQLDISLPSSAGSSMPGSAGQWTGGTTPTTGLRNGYFDHIQTTPRSSSPLSQRPSSPDHYRQNNGSGAGSSSLSRSHSLTHSHPSHSRSMSPTHFQNQQEYDRQYEEILNEQQQGHNPHYNPHQPSDSESTYDQWEENPGQHPRSRQHTGNKQPNLQRRPSSHVVSDVESLAMAHNNSSMSDTSSMHQNNYSDAGDHSTFEIQDFKDNLGWDFSQVGKLDTGSTDAISLHGGDKSSNVSKVSLSLEQKDMFQRLMGHPLGEARVQAMIHEQENGSGVNRSNSSSSNGSFSKRGGVPENSQVHDRQLSGERKQRLQQQVSFSPNSNRTSISLQRAQTSSKPRVHHRGVHGSPTSPAVITVSMPNRKSPHLRRSISLDPKSMGKKSQRTATELRQLAMQAGMAATAESFGMRLQESEDDEHQQRYVQNGSFSLESSPQDLERPHIPQRTASQGLGRSALAKSRTKLEIDVGRHPHHLSQDGLPELTPVSNQSSNSSINTSPKHSQDGGAGVGVGHKNTFEVLSRPKEIENSTLFSPVSPVSPRTAAQQQHSKFQEILSDRPVSPPPGYAGGSNGHRQGIRRSPTQPNLNGSSPSSMSTKSGPSPKSNAMLAARSKSMANMNAPTRSATSSTVSSGTQQSSKAGSFIKALSHKLRSKNSEEGFNNGTKGNSTNTKQSSSASKAGEAGPSLQSVSFAPPRLELDFLGDLGTGGGGQSSPTDSTESHFPPQTAPPVMAGSHHRHRLPDASSASSTTDQDGDYEDEDDLTTTAGGSGSLLDRPKGFTGGRRSSATLFGSGNIALREQRRKIEKARAARAAAAAAVAGISSSPKSASPLGREQKGTHTTTTTATVGTLGHKKSLEGGPLSDGSYTTDDGTSEQEDQVSGLPSSKKSGSQNNNNKAGPKAEYRFSTATLLKDGKLYYQLQWDQFSEVGFKSDFFHEPEQYLSGIHQKRMSRAMGGTSSSDPMSMQDGRNPNGTLSNASMNHKAARDSFLAMAKNDPKFLAAARSAMQQSSPLGRAVNTSSVNSSNSTSSGPSRSNTGSTSGSYLDADYGSNGKTSIDSSISSIHPHQRFNTAESQYPSPPVSRQLSLNSSPAYPSRTDSNHSLMGALSDNGAEHAHQRSTSGGSLPTSSATGPASSALKGSTKAGVPTTVTMIPVGKAAAGGGSRGAASLSTASSSATLVAEPTIVKKKSKFFGRSKSSNNVMATPATSTKPTKIPKNKRMPAGVLPKDVMTKTVESLDEVFPWMCIEHMAGQDSDWVMLEPVKDGVVGWIKIDKLEEEMARLAIQQPNAA